MSGNEQTSWYQGTDEETSALINKKQWDSPDAMAKSYLNLEQMNGDQSKIVKLPDFNLITSFFKLFSFGFTKCRHTLIELIVNPLRLFRCK
jgi:hypothetical protein